MANTKNSQAAKIRKQIIAWLQDDTQTEVVSATKFPGIRGIRAVTLRAMLGELDYATPAIMGAVSAAPSIDHRIKKAALKPREVYYYYDGTAPVHAKKTVDSAPEPQSTVPRPAPVATPTAAVAGLAGTPAFSALLATNGQLAQAVDDLLTAAQDQAPLAETTLDFLSDLATQTAKQTELLQNFASQDRIAQLRRK